MICFDAVYNPKESKFLKDAKISKATIINGLDMLVFQGAISFEIWTDKEAPIDIMKEACLNKLMN